MKTTIALAIFVSAIVVGAAFAETEAKNSIPKKEATKPPTTNDKRKERLGESIEECRKRFGKEFSVKGPVALFKKAGLEITVIFSNEKAAAFAFKKENLPPNTDGFTQAEMQAILEIYSFGKKWNAVPPQEMKAMWLRSDQRIIARYDGGSLELVGVDEIADSQKSQKEATSRTLEGF